MEAPYIVSNESYDDAYLMFSKILHDTFNNRGNLITLLDYIKTPPEIIEFISDNHSENLLKMGVFYPGGIDGIQEGLARYVKQKLFGAKPHRIYLKSITSVKENGKFTRDMLGIIHYLNKNSTVYLNKIDLLEEVDDELIPNKREKWFMPKTGHIPLAINDKITAIFTSTVVKKAIKKKEGDGYELLDVTEYNIELFSWLISASEMITFINESTKKMEDELSEILQKESYFYMHLKDDLFERYSMPITNKKWENTFFEGADDIETVVYNFIKNEGKDNFNAKHLGIGIFGKPGNGKTSAIKCILNQCRSMGKPRHSVMVNFNNIRTIEQLYDIFCGDQLTIHGKLPQDQRLYVLEDFDCATISASRVEHEDDELTNVTDYGHLLGSNLSNATRDMLNNIIKEKMNNSITLGDLLNIIDGAVESPGRMLVMTSNYRDRIDPALLRPGRLDVSVEIQGSRNVDIKNILNSHFDTDVKEGSLNFQDYTFSNAEVSNICRMSKNESVAISKMIEIEKERLSASIAEAEGA